MLMDLKKKGGYEIDHYLYLKIIRDGWNAFHIAEPLLKYRQHSIKQTSAKHFLKEKYSNPLLIDKTKEDLIEEYILLEKKIISLEKNLNKITSAKFYKLWQWYCNLHNRLVK